MFVRLCLTAALLAGAAVAQPMSHDYVRFDLPDVWVRNDESRFASFSPVDDREIVLMVATRLGDEGADDALEDFIERAEGGETVVARKDVQEIADDDFEVLSQETQTRDQQGRAMRRLYLAADPEDTDTVVVFGGTQDAFARHEQAGRAILASAAFGNPTEPTPTVSLDPMPGEGDLDGVYRTGSERPYLDAKSGRWMLGHRAEMLVLDPMGEAYRGAPERFGPEIFERCDSSAAWRCGRYRVEGGEIVMRWRDGSVDRRRLEQLGDGLAFDGNALKQVVMPTLPPLAKAYIYRDDFNTGAWPVTLGETRLAPTIHFHEDGRFLIVGFTSIRNPQFGKDISVQGRYKVDGRTVTLVYPRGTTEVLGYARWQDGDMDVVLIGGRPFVVRND